MITLKKLWTELCDSAAAQPGGPHDEARILKIGMYTLVVGFGGFLLWASVAIPARLIGLFT